MKNQNDNLKIKPLVWHPSGETLQASALDQHYLINPSRMIDHFKLDTPDGSDYFSTQDLAKEAAQKDFERRLRSVILFNDAEDQKDPYVKKVAGRKTRLVIQRNDGKFMQHNINGGKGWTSNPLHATDRSGYVDLNVALLHEHDCILVEFEVVARPTGRTTKDLFKDGKLIVE